MRALSFSLVIVATALVANLPGHVQAVPGGGGADEFDPGDIDEPDAPDIDPPDEIDAPDIPDETVDAPDPVDEPDVVEGDDVSDSGDTPDIDQSELESNGDVNEDTADDVEPDEIEVGEDGGANAPEGQGDVGENRSGRGHGGRGDDGDSGSADSGGSAVAGGSSQSGAAGGGGESDIVERHRNGTVELETDELGEEFLAREVLLAGPAEDVLLAQREGYRIISDDTLGGNGRHLARLLAPAHLKTSDAVAALQALTPNSLVTPNSAYRSTQAGRSQRASTQETERRATRNIIIGVIDTGVDEAMANAGVVAMRAFGQGGYSVREHGSSVAAVLADQSVRMRVADVFGATSRGDPIASASAIAAALHWMTEARVPVINVSIEGPSNEILRRMIADATRDGFVIVAAAGNGGPLAAPAFPAAYEGVVAVTAVDGSGRPYPRANRGEYVDFAAFGVDVPVQLGGATLSVSGTSFAAPIVAVRIAEHLSTPSPSTAASAIDAVRGEAVDRGAPGRDPVYGWGIVRTR